MLKCYISGSEEWNELDARWLNEKDEHLENMLYYAGFIYEAFEHVMRDAYLSKSLSIDEAREIFELMKRECSHCIEQTSKFFEALYEEES